MMQLRPTPESVTPRLAAALRSPSLPARAALAGQQLLERLSSPIRVAVLGYPGSGKSQLLNLIAGERIIPPGAQLPTLELRFGPERRATLVEPGHRETRVPFDSLGTLGREAGSFLVIEAPLPVLGTLTLFEVAAAGTAEEERAGVQWAASRSDVVIWCSQTFTAAERWLWSGMPERLKDHGFLVLTKADDLVRAGTLGQVLAELEEVVAEEFHSLVPVATLQGLAALFADNGTDRDALAASGAEALVSALLGHVEQGRRADLDAALLFLSRFAKAMPSALPGEEPLLVGAAEPVALSTDTADVGPAPEVTQEDAVERSLDILRACAGTLRERIGEDGHAEAVLEGCAQAAQTVADMLDSAASVQHLHDEAMEVAEMLVLLGLERSDSAAADAVTLLLQLSRELAYPAAA